jgi:hypothetical protein
VVETPTYDLTVFKVHYGKMTLKIYTKGERVLRTKLIVHNTKEYRWGRSLPCFGDIVVRLRDILERFLNAVGCLDACFVADETLETLPLPTKVGQTKVGGIDFNKPRMRQVAEAVMALSTSPNSPAGFTASHLAQKVRKKNGRAEANYGPRRAAYDLKKLRSKGMVRKIGTLRRYEPEPDGLRAMAALVVLREKVIRPLLAAANGPSHRPNPTIPHRSITTTNISEWACGSCLRRWGWSHRIDNSFFIFVSKLLGFDFSTASGIAARKRAPVTGCRS